MDLLQEYKELYYKEIEFGDRLNNKITTCITFLTILGSALILLWTQIKNYELFWYTGVYLVFCIIVTIMFFICIGMFFKTYSGYKTQLFPIKSYAIQNTNVLNTVDPEQKDKAKELLKQKMAERYINDAIHNRELNTIKNNRHRNLIKMIMATFIIMFITFSINIVIDYYETNYINTNVQEIQ
ncbi:MAG: hypothetical protein NC430_10685 [bacterium]|nr:hypothetical protein [bacterium]MCM1423661.1 hypothetical protein [bacterium]